MLSHKLLLDEVEEDYVLLAIHSSLEDYKITYFLNKYLQVNFSRARHDLDFNHGAVQALYPLFIFKEPTKYRNYFLVKNKFRGALKKVVSSGSLFTEEDVTSKSSYLIPEYKDVDYFLKIDEELSPDQIQNLLNRIATIPNVQTIYEVDHTQLKSKNNLILE
jgi:hypothetical protein